MRDRVVSCIASICLLSCVPDLPGPGDLDTGQVEGPAGEPAPSGGPSGCGSYEDALAGQVCASRSRTCAALRFETPAPAAGTLWCPPGIRVDETEAVSYHHLVIHGLAPAAAYACSYGIFLGPGAGTVAFTVTLGPTAPVTGPIVTEVLLNPAGSEPGQEFVEIANVEAFPVDLGGWGLSDGSSTDAIPAGTVLLAGGVAILVPAGYESGGADPAPAAGCLVIRLDGSLGRSGLRNSGGEPVLLLGPDGAEVSLYPNALGTTSQGRSARRLGAGAPDGDVANWIEDFPTPGIAWP